MFLKILEKFYTLCHVWRLCMLLLATLLITQTSYFADIDLSHYARLMHMKYLVEITFTFQLAAILLEILK